MLGAWLVTIAAAAAGSSGPAADIAKLQQEVRELRQMLIQSMQVEEQRYELLLKLLQSTTGTPPPALPGTLPHPAAAAPESKPGTRTGSGTLTGRVEVTGAPREQPVYVFVENVRAAPARGRSVEIVQKGKQFAPQVLAVQRGTQVRFPNADRVAHNVFSLSRHNAFDVGLMNAGNAGSPVVMGEPGVVEIYCDIHAKMWAEVLVTPNGLYTQVDGDGRFRLGGVPAGERVISVWTAGVAPVKKTVTVGAGPVEVGFSLTVPPRRAHNNKLGQPYGNYGGE
jgi:plastocyanin